MLWHTWFKTLHRYLKTNLARSPHFLMLFAAVAHALDGIPAGGIGEEMPDRDSRALGGPGASGSKSYYAF